MIVKSLAQSRIIGGTVPSQTAAIEFEEQCSLCDQSVPDGAVVLRHVETNNIICVPCLGFIALLNPDDPIQ